MQIPDLQTLYPQFQSTLAAFPDNTIALCLYQSRDRVHFHAYPQPALGFPTSTFPAVLPELKTFFAVQATGAFIRAAIESATMLHEIDIGCGYSIPVFDDAAQLASAGGHCQSYAFVRSDACLVVWADSVVTVMPIWHDITFRLQSQLVHPNTMPGLPGNTYDIDELLHPNTFDIHPAQHGGFTQLPTDSLSSLSELSFLEMVPLPNAPSPTLDNYQYPDPTTWLWGDNTSPGMGLLQHELQMLNTSEPSIANGVPSYSFGDLPLTVNLATISPPPVGVFDLPQEEDQKSSASSSSSCGLSLDLASDSPVSPSSYSQSPNTQQTFFTETTPSEPFRRHSVGPSSAPERIIGEKTKRDGGDGGRDTSYEDDDHSYVDVTAEESYFPATATAGVAHTSKRRRAAAAAAAASAMIIPKATSAPARFIVPLPNIVESVPQCDDDDTSSISSASTNQTSFAPSPAPPTRRASRGGRSRRVPRTKCEFCPKTFTRPQDALRHAASSCADNPQKSGVRCPECGEVLSRLDSAQRHWRGHDSPRCEAPEWAQSHM